VTNASRSNNRSLKYLFPKSKKKNFRKERKKKREMSLLLEVVFEGANHWSMEVVQVFEKRHDSLEDVLPLFWISVADFEKQEQKKREER
jgi:hypothetical protein